MGVYVQRNELIATHLIYIHNIFVSKYHIETWINIISLLSFVNVQY